MSENKHEIPKSDREKKANYYPTIPEAKGYSSKQENFDVGSVGAERQGVGYGTGNFNVKKPNLKRGAQQ